MATALMVMGKERAIAFMEAQQLHGLLIYEENGTLQQYMTAGAKALQVE
jgi:thiamine biosynthesis lipoprotein ApbE